MRLTAIDRSFISRFNRSGANFAGTMRRWLPATVKRDAQAQQARTLILRAARKAEEEMQSAAKSWAHRSIPMRVRAAAELAASQMEGHRTLMKEQGISIKRAFQFGGVNEKLSARLLEDAGKKLTNVLSTTTQVAFRRLREASLAIGRDPEISLALAKGVLDQGTMRDLTQRVLAATGLDAEDKVVLSNGREWDAEYYAELTARTRTLEAANEGYAAQLQSYGEDFFYVPAHDGVKKTDVCYALQGKVWAFRSSNSLGIPSLESLGRDRPPWHPNCAHTVAPWVIELQTDGEIDQAIAAHDDDARLMDEVKN